MHNGRWRRPYAVLVWYVCICIGIFGIAHSLFAQTSTVELSVPQTQIIVKGQASPGAQVIVYINGSESGTTVADTYGSYSVDINNLNAGTYTVAAEAIDVTGVTSTRAKREVAVNLQQTSMVTFFLAPTAIATPVSQSYGNNQIQFSGYTASNAQVRIRIDNGSLVLTTRANNQGYYKVAVTTNTLAVGIFDYRSEAHIGADVSEPDTLAKQFIVTPPVTPEITSNPEADPPRSAEPRSQQETASPITPIVFAPESGSRVEGSHVVLNGSATPGSEVLVYDGGDLVGAVIANVDGGWQFYFQATEEVHRLQTRGCISERCSDFSDKIELSFGLIRGECALDVRLSSYRLITTPGEPAHIASTNSLIGPNIFAIVNWGDESEQRFTISSGDILSTEYAYSDTGVFNGYVIATDGNNCTDTKYFTVQVSEPMLKTDSIFASILLVVTWAIVAISITLYSRVA